MTESFSNGMMAAPMAAQADVAFNMMSASVSSSGDMSASYLFEIGYKVNVTKVNQQTEISNSQSTPRHRLLIDKVFQQLSRYF
jgi:hypothetical protein